ncbi:MAG: hypothetical protein HQ596_08850 [Candidatus Saganbacteria bacterium]|nr:hypothetical protein [Candidatus Saganbacteria bacterium]
MGGSVALTLREQNGTQHRMCRSTNILPWVMNNMKLVRKAQEHIQAVLKDWKMMCKDHERNKGTGEFENEMTDVYAPYPHLTPIDYGLVVIDMREDVILTAQEYTSPGWFYAVSIAIDMAKNAGTLGVVTALSTDQPHPAKLGRTVFDLTNDQYEAVRLKAFVEAGRVEVRDSETDRLMHSRGETDLARVIALAEQKKHYLFHLDLAPFTIERFEPHNLEDMTRLKARVLELGFRLSREEDAEWDGWLEGLAR